MSEKIIIKKETKFQNGIILNDNTLSVVCELHAISECGLLLFDKKSEDTIKIPFTDELKTGDLYCASISGVNFADYTYSFYEDNKQVVDPYAKKLAKKLEWGQEKESVRFSFYQSDFDWGKDKNPEIRYENSVMYGLHVRGFTKHASSGCKAKGTFHGVAEKIPYMKELGINCIVTMPIYEFDEIENLSVDTKYLSDRYKDDVNYEKKINYWGFKTALYMIPKSAYSYSENAVDELKDLICRLHKNDIEFIMQIYFPESIRHGYIMDVLRYWITEYHVDGFELKGSNLPLKDITTDPLLKKTKLLYEGYDLNYIYPMSTVPTYRNLAIYNEQYMNTVRSFLKGDNDTIYKAFSMMRSNPEKCANINYLTDYDTFTLSDLFMYDRKHNEKNGENNADGRDYNYSWNCGVEGPSRKKSIQELRLKMRKNAMLLLMTSAGTPFFMAGDEFGNSQEGNNNPYCQDNDTCYLNWNNLKKENEFYLFVHKVIELRRTYKHFQRKKECTMMDSIGCGYPDLSVHSDEAWRAKLENYNHSFGLLFCGKYVHDECDIYIAYNMYWQKEKFALPALPSNKKWYLIGDTSLEQSFIEETLIKETSVTCDERSIMILLGH